MLALSTHDLHRARGMNGLGRILVAVDSLDMAEEQFKAALAAYGESTNRVIQVQMVWSNAHLGVINLKRQNKYQTFKYLEQAREHLSSLSN